MKIKKMQINGFGGLENKEINLENGINIISGNNESGKSTILNYILAMFFGLSKNKNGKEISNYDKYIPWNNLDFSGSLEYELDNKETYKIYRTFQRRTLKLYNSYPQEVTNSYGIDRNKESTFFMEQTKIDEALFIKSFCAKQEEMKLDIEEQNNLIQKITNLLQTGNDNIQFNRIINKLNKKMTDEIGNNKTKNKPINIIIEEIKELKLEKEELEEYKNKKGKNLQHKKELLEKINLLNDKKEIILEIEKIKIKEKNEIDKIKVEKNILEREIIQKDNNVNNEDVKRKSKHILTSIAVGILLLLNILLNSLFFLQNLNWIFKGISLSMFFINLIMLIISVKKSITLRQKKHQENIGDCYHYQVKNNSDIKQDRINELKKKKERCHKDNKK